MQWPTAPVNFLLSVRIHRSEAARELPPLRTMPELVACPSCGCKVQAAEMFLGQRMRCIACSGVFVATPDLAPPPSGEPSEAAGGYPLRPEPTPSPRPPAPSETRGPARHRLPLCPRCHRPVTWQALGCPHCGHLLDPQDGDGRGQWARRRDAQPHRGRTIDSLGSFSLFGAVLSLCTGPLGVIVALATGIPALVMACNDLEQMRAGAVDSFGQSVTEFGRNKAILGVVLALLFGVFFFMVFVGLPWL